MLGACETTHQIYSLPNYLITLVLINPYGDFILFLTMLTIYLSAHYGF